MVITTYQIQDRDGITRSVSFMNLKFSYEFNRPAANNKVGDWINVRPGVSGRIQSIKHEFYNQDGKKYSQSKTFRSC